MFKHRAKGTMDTGENKTDEVHDIMMLNCRTSKQNKQLEIMLLNKKVPGEEISSENKSFTYLKIERR